MRSLIKPVWSNYRSARCMWVATAFSVARGSIQKISSNLKFLKSVWGYICFMDLLALDKVYLHNKSRTMNNTFSMYHYCFCFIYFFTIPSAGAPDCITSVLFSVPWRWLSGRVHLEHSGVARGLGREARLSWRGPIGHRRGTTSQHSEKSQEMIVNPDVADV